MLLGIMATIIPNHYEPMARMASKSLHEAFIERATKDRYLLPDEVFEDFLSSVRRLILHSDDPLKERYLNLYVYSIQESDKAPKDAFYGSPQWDNIRTAVQNFLAHLTVFDLGEWERKELPDA
jgi:hypothetical protein